MKNLKTLGGACIAALALIALVGAASASASQFRAESYSATYSGEQTEWGGLYFKFKGSGGGIATLECTQHRLAGTMSSASSTLTATPNFNDPGGEGCEMLGLHATVKPNGCKYALQSTNESAPYTASLAITCNKAGEEIEVTASTCKITIPAQSGLGTVTLTNTGSGSSRGISASFNVTGIKVTGSAGCGSGLQGTASKSELKGTNVLSGSNPWHSLGIYVANEQMTGGVPQFNVENKAATISGEVVGSALVHVHQFNFECYEGWAEGNPVPQPDFPFVIGECELAGATFAVNNGCAFGLTAGSEAGVAGMGLYCPAAPLTFTSATCQIKIASQQVPDAMTYENVGTGSSRKVILHMEMEGIKYEEPYCGGGSGSFSDGALSMTWELKASEGGLWVS